MKNSNILSILTHAFTIISAIAALVLVAECTTSLLHDPLVIPYPFNSVHSLVGTLLGGLLYLLLLLFILCPVHRKKLRATHIRFSLEGDSAERFAKLSGGYGGELNTIVTALRLLEVATAATAAGSQAVVLNPDGTVRLKLVQKL
jgi:hypothetical protein